MARPIRQTQPRLDQLIELCESRSAKLNYLIAFPVDNIRENSDDLNKLAVDLKTELKEYNSICHDTVCALFKNGSVTQGNELKEDKLEKRREVKEIILCIREYLTLLGNVDEFSIPATETSSLCSVQTNNVNVGTCNSNVNDSPHSFHTIDCTYQSNNTHANEHQLLNANNESYDNIQPPEDNITQVQSKNHVHFSNGNEQPSTNFSYEPTYNRFQSNQYRFATVGSVDNVSVNPIHVNNPFDSAYRTPFPDLTHSYQPVNYVHAKSNPFVCNPPPFPSSNVTYPQQHSSDSRSYPCRPDNSNSLFPPTRPNYPTAPAAHRVTQVDNAGMHIARQQLFQKAANPFSGEAHKFNAWINGLENKMAGLNLSSYDRLLVLESNTTGEPLKLVQNHLALGGPDPSSTLGLIYRELKSEFGSSVRVTESLTQKIDSFSPIKSCYQVDQLKELLHLCQLVDVNASLCEDLSFFNTAYGARKIWLKLPETLQNSWRSVCDDFRVKNNDRYPHLSIFIQFLSKKIRELNDPLLPCPSFPNDKRKEIKTTMKTESETAQQLTSAPSQPTLTQSATEPTEQGCPLHPRGIHPLNECRRFLNLKHNEKTDLLKQNGLCFLCFGKHIRANCVSDIKCSTCNENHNTAMHFDRRKQTSGMQVADSLCTTLCGNNNVSRSCSKTVLVDVSIRGHNKTLRCYAILDEQSNASFADPKIAEYFNVTGPVSDYSLKTLSNFSTKTDGMTLIGVQVRGVRERKRITLPPILTNAFIPNNKKEIACPRVVNMHSHLRHLSDKFCDVDEQADILLLIGRDSGECMYTRCHGNRPPFAHHTALGWALVGDACKGRREENCISSYKTNIEHFEIEKCFKTEPKWSLPDLDAFHENADDELPGLSQEDRKFVQLISGGKDTNETGHIVLPLPFKTDNPTLPDNRREVFSRTKNTLTRLTKDEDKLKQSLNVMQKYLDFGHVEPVPDNEQTPERPGQAWWIPIFPVVHPKKQKVRLVFDSSAKYNNTCLNDVLLQGPDINNRLKDVLVGFRRGYIGFSADIETMFHNFFLKESDRDYLRFYWFAGNDPAMKLCQYRARVHIFGNKSSPAIACMGLKLAASSSNFDYVQQFVNDQFYVDDGLGCADTTHDAIQLLDETRHALQKYNIRLHKLCSSHDDVLNAFPPSERATSNSSLVELEESSIHTALGLIWDTSPDEIIIRADIPHRPFTRRGVLATVNSVFDPLGISSPVVLEGKLIQRQLLSGTDPATARNETWDVELPSVYKPLWDSWKSSLRGLSGLRIPRCYRPVGFGSHFRSELHAFCDASIEGTGHAIYLKSINDQNLTHVSFVCGSSKIAPKSSVSIPRLELCAAVDVSMTTYEIANKLSIEPDKVFFYSDSMIVLGYLKNTERRFSRYVSRRVDMILRSFSSSRWNYVSTSDNPADIASRKQSVDDLLNSCWLKGPEFLWHDNLPDEFVQPEDLPETITEKIVLKTTLPDSAFDSLFTRCGSLTKIINVTARVLDFCNKLADSSKQTQGIPIAPRGPTSRDQAIHVLITEVQRSTFPDLFIDSHSNNNKLHNLAPFVNNNIIRVGGRLSRSKLEYEHKYPILLPNNHPFTTLLVRHFHAKSKHQGRVITLSSIREAGYFITKASLTIKKLISNCFTCKRLRLSLSHQLMSDLPSDRLECVPPFTNTGMDVFGPYHVSDGISTRRTNSQRKCWALIFTCLNSRATHIEPLPFMDTNTMRNAIRRFMCIRGTCKRLRSDQGSNFIGARNQESTINFEEVESEIKSQNCTWELTPPKASHFGGVWERQIKSVKNILATCFSQLGNRPLTRDDLYTFFQECCSILNNTPLWEYSSNPNDPRPLTPAMLLTLRTDTPYFCGDFGEKDIIAYGSRRWRRTQYLSDIFWKRWRTDYLQTLQPRRKWYASTRCFVPGDVVLLRDDAAKRYQWPIARVVSVKKSPDGLVRSVIVATASRGSRGVRELCRPVTELSLLVPSSV